MINENELRNNVLVYRIEENYEPLKEKKVIAWDTSIWYGIGDCVDRLENYEPIPLTEEWEVKFGFEQTSEYSIELNISGYCLEVQFKWGNKTFYNGAEIKPLLYVHQLQNLYFSLTQTELEIKQSKP